MSESGSEGDNDSFLGDYQEIVVPLDPVIYDSLMTGGKEDQLSGLQKLREILSNRNYPPKKAIIDAKGFLQRIVELINDENENIQLEAVWTIALLASAVSHERMQAVVNTGVIPKLINLMKSSSNESLKEKVALAIGNFIGDSAPLRDMVLQAGVLQPLLEMIQQKNAPEALLSNAIWSLLNITRHKPSIDLETIKPALPVINELFRTLKDGDDALKEVCWMVANLTDVSEAHTQAILDFIDLQPLFKLIYNDLYIEPALRAIGNVATGNDLQTERLFQYDIVGHLVKLIDHPKKNTRKEVLWIFSNLTAGTQKQIQAVIDSGIILKIISLYPDCNMREKMDIAYIIGNITQAGSREQSVYIIENGGVELLFQQAEIKSEPERARIAIESLENLQKLMNSGLDDHFMQKLNSLNLAEKVKTARSEFPDLMDTNPANSFTF